MSANDDRRGATTRRIQDRLKEQRREEFDRQVADGTLKVRKMTKAERESGVVKPKLKPRHRRYT